MLLPDHTGDASFLRQVVYYIQVPCHHSLNDVGCFVAYSCTRILFFGVGENDYFCFALW